MQRITKLGEKNNCKLIVIRARQKRGEKIEKKHTKYEN